MQIIVYNIIYTCHISFMIFKRIFAIIIFFLIFNLSSLAEEIKLNNNNIYVKKGFSSTWLDRIPDNDKTWLVIPPTRKDKSLRISELPIPGIPKRTFFSYKHYKPLTFTFITSFALSRDVDLSRKFLGLYIDQIAENWEVYLNGNLIKKEMYLKPDGEIQEFRDQRRVLIYLNPLLLKSGINIIAFRIVGDVSMVDTGFYTNKPLVIDNYEKLSREKTRLIQLILLFVYLMAGLYLLLLYLYRRTERYNLIFAIFSIMLFIYLFCRTSTVYSIVPDTRWTLLVEFLSLYTLIPLLMYFMDLILFGRISRFVYGYSAFCLSLIVLSAVSPYPVRIDILRIWQLTSIFPAFYFIFFQIIHAFLITVRHYRYSGGAGVKPGLMTSIRHSIARTVPGNLMAGAMVAVGCTIFDVLDAMFFTTGIVITNYGFMFFVIGITIVLSNRYVYLYRAIDGLSVDLRQKTRDLKETQVQYGISQEKYRLLVEGSTDIIFSLDENFNFLTANKAMHDLLHINSDYLIKRNLLDVLHQPDQISVSIQFLQEKLEKFKEEKKPLNIRLDFKTSFGIEPVSLQVRLEYINIEGRYEIFGRGTSITEDILNQYMESEQHRYSIGNMLLVADDLSIRITRNLQKFVNRKDLGFIRLAIREIIINAIEHGNLAITFEEKSREMSNDNYFNYLNERQKDPRFSGRTVKVEYSVDSEKIIYTIVDEGKGFDYTIYLSDETSANESMLMHGRGIALAKSIFDEIKYNDTGNAVTLVKWLNKNK